MLSNSPAQPKALSHGSPVVMVVGTRGIPDVEGGAEKNAEMLFPRIAAAGYRVVLLGLSGLIRSPYYGGVELRSAPYRRILGTDKLAYYLYAIKVARELKPDIVHLQGLGAALFMFAYKLMGARTVVRYGSADYTLKKWGLIGRSGFRLSEIQAGYADAIIAVAPSLVQRLADHGITGNVHLVANAIDDTPPSRSTETKINGYQGEFILAVARITSQKNIHNIVNGFKEFRHRTGSTHRLLLAGGLDDKSYVESIRPLLDDSIELLGHCTRERLEELYQSCALFINGSVHEGSCNAVLEAISRRCPIILSDIPENRDFGVPGHIYFDPANVDAIADAMKVALREPQRHQVDPSTFLSWDLVAEKTLSIYRSILAS